MARASPVSDLRFSSRFCSGFVQALVSKPLKDSGALSTCCCGIAADAAPKSRAEVATFMVGTMELPELSNSLVTNRQQPNEVNQRVVSTGKEDGSQNG